MLPIRNEEMEKDEKVPKILCQMENHQGIVENLFL